MNITSKSEGGSWASRLWLVPLLLYGLCAFRDLGLPGLYMDAANPDYQAAWLMRGALQMPAWIYPDNMLAGEFGIPLLNSLYGGNPTAYVAGIFFGVFGFGLGEVRMLHALLGLGLIAAWAYMLRTWKVAALPAALALAWLATDPTFVLAWRTQYYLQLFPAILFAFALAHLGRHFHQLQAGPALRRHLLWAGALLGFAAYSYFIFAIYAFAVICVYTLSVRRMRSGRVLWPLCAMAALGWSPYVFAHLSIVKNIGLSGYLDALRGLQGAYGVVNVDQGGWVDRLVLVGSKLNLLIAGRGVELKIFADAMDSAASSAFQRAFLVVVAIGGLALALWHGLRKGSPAERSRRPASPTLLIRLLVAVLVMHLLLGLALGEPLQLQHYVMLLPVMAAMLAAGWTSIAAGVAIGGTKLMNAVAVIALGIAIALNVMLCASVFDRLRKEGGVGLYSDVINVAAAHLQVQRGDGALLFPQWGYWMGITTIVGPRMSMYETQTLEKMVARLQQDPDLKKHRDFTLVLGHEVGALPVEAIDTMAAEFARATGLAIADRTLIVGRNGRDRVVLVRMKRSAP